MLPIKLRIAVLQYSEFNFWQSVFKANTAQYKRFIKNALREKRIEWILNVPQIVQTDFKN